MKEKILKIISSYTSRFNETSFFKNPTKEEEKIRENFLKGVKIIQSLSSKCNLKHTAFIKIKNIPKPHSDVDVITSRGELKIMLIELEKLGFTINADLGYEYSVRREERNGFPIVIDIHTNIQYNNCDFLNPNKVIKRKLKLKFDGKEIVFISPEDDFIITLVHSMFQKVSYFRADYYDKLRWSEFTLNDLHQMHYATSHKNFDWNYVVETARKYCWEDALTYSLIILDKYFPTKKNKNIIHKAKTDETFKNKMKKDVEKNNSLPFYTSIPLMYKICLHKAFKEIKVYGIKGAVTFIRYQKWFVVNFGRYIRNKIKKRILK